MTLFWLAVGSVIVVWVRHDARRDARLLVAMAGRLEFFGQEFYPTARFPSLDFSLVHPLDAGDRPADLPIAKRGPKTPPGRVIPARIRWRSEIPETLDVLPGTLDDLEAMLRPSRGQATA